MVAANTALGTDFSGLSTLSSLAQADSNPKKAQNIMGAVAVTGPWQQLAQLLHYGQKPWLNSDY